LGRDVPEPTARRPGSGPARSPASPPPAPAHARRPVLRRPKVSASRPTTVQEENSYTMRGRGGTASPSTAPRKGRLRGPGRADPRRLGARRPGGLLARGPPDGRSRSGHTTPSPRCGTCFRTSPPVALHTVGTLASALGGDGGAGCGPDGSRKGTTDACVRGAQSRDLPPRPDGGPPRLRRAVPVGVLAVLSSVTGFGAGPMPDPAVCPRIRSYTPSAGTWSAIGTSAQGSGRSWRSSVGWLPLTVSSQCAPRPLRYSTWPRKLPPLAHRNAVEAVAHQ